jgi:fructokinase
MADGEILCVGEMLWDALPSGLFLGGAPFNVACHLRAAGLPAALATRVGADRLGEEALRRLAWYGIDGSLVQVDEALPTGFVRVAVDEPGRPAYDILEPVAWDAIAPDEALLARAASARALVFGTLAQRSEASRATHERIWDCEGLRVLNLNRAPYAERELVRRSLAHADVVKLSEEELATLAGWLGLKGAVRRAAAALAETFGCDAVCVTRGRGGAGLWRAGRWSEHPGFEVEVRDSVGAGDAFLAILVAGLLGGGQDAVILRHASLMGAYVATQPGALPADQPAAVEPPRATTRRRPRRS